MLKLKSRQKFIPNGFRFYLPEVKWSAPAGQSFNLISQGLFRVVQANPALAEKNHWPTTLQGCEDWVDFYNATVCYKQGWKDYIITDEGAAAPKFPAPHQQASLSGIRAVAEKAKKLVRGARTLEEYVMSNEPAVAPEVSTLRAQVCAACPKNQQGDWTEWFTIPAAEIIKRMLNRFQARKLSTPSDDRLNCCTVCWCPMKLKVHIPITWIVKHQDPEEAQELAAVPGCWIPKEASK